MDTLSKASISPSLKRVILDIFIDDHGPCRAFKDLVASAFACEALDLTCFIGGVPWSSGTYCSARLERACCIVGGRVDVVADSLELEGPTLMGVARVYGAALGEA